MKLFEALRILKKVGFVVENERKISDDELAELIMAGYEDKFKTKFTGDEYKKYMDVAHYIAAYYADMDNTSKDEMTRGGVRALREFIAYVERWNDKEAFKLCRQARYSDPEKKIDWLEDLRVAVEQKEAEDEEDRWQAHKETDAYKHRNDPGWRGPRGRWTLD